MNNTIKFSSQAFRQAHLKFVLVIITLSLLFDVWCFFSLTNNIPQSAINDFFIQRVWTEVHFFFIIINFIFLKFGIFFWYFNKKKAYQNGFIEILDDKLIHVEQNNAYSKWFVKNAIGYVSDESKEHYAQIEKYNILKVTTLTKDWRGFISIKGKIEMELINEMLDEEFGSNRENAQPRILNLHKIRPYYERYDEVYQKLKSLSQTDEFSLKID